MFQACRPAGRLFYLVLAMVVAASGASPAPQGGPTLTSVVDMTGMLALALIKANELKTCLTLIVRSTDGADPNLVTLNDILASLS
jgi:hypothetical protein